MVCSGLYDQIAHTTKTCTTQSPLTSGLSSLTNLYASSARGRPILSSSRKKFTPASSPSVILSSRIVNPPIPVVSSSSFQSAHTRKDEVFKDFCSCGCCVDETKSGTFKRFLSIC